MEQLYKNSPPTDLFPDKIAPSVLLQAWQHSGLCITLLGAGPANFPILWASEEYCRITGYKGAELIGAEFGLLQLGNENQPAFIGLREALRRGFTQEANLRSARRNGELFDEEVRISPLRSPTGRIEYFVCSHRDITAQQSQLLQLTRSKEALEDLLFTTGAVLWDADAESMQFLHITDTVETLLGHSVHAWLSAPKFWESLLHPDDAEMALSFRNRMASRGRPHELDYRLRHADGRWINVRDDVRGFFEDGGAICMRGTLVPVKESQSLPPAPESPAAQPQPAAPAAAPVKSRKESLEEFCAASAASGKVRSWALVSLGRRAFLTARYSSCGVQRLQASYTEYFLDLLPPKSRSFVLGDAGILIPIGESPGFFPTDSLLKDKANRCHNTTLTLEKRSAMLCLTGHVDLIPAPANQPPEAAAAAIREITSRISFVEHALDQAHS